MGLIISGIRVHFEKKKNLNSYKTPQQIIEKYQQIKLINNKQIRILSNRNIDERKQYEEFIKVKN